MVTIRPDSAVVPALRSLFAISVMLLCVIQTLPAGDGGAATASVSHMKLAEAYYRLNQIGESRAALDSIEQSHRGWAWNVLSSRVDRSSHTFARHSGAVVAAAVSPDGSLVATGSADSSIIVWNGNTRDFLFTLSGHRGQVTTLAFSPDGTQLLSGSTDRTLRIWNLKSRSEVRNYNHEVSRGIYQAIFSPDGNRIGFVSWELSPGNQLPVLGFAKVLDRASGSLIRRFDTDNHPAAGIAFSADGADIITGTWGFHVKRHDISTGATEWDYDISNVGYYTAIQSVDISSDGARVVLCGKDNRIRLLDASNGSLILQIEPWQGHKEWINSVRFSPDGRRFASGSDDGLVMVWETSTGSRLLTFRGHTAGVNRIAWYPDGTRLLSTSADGTMKEWNLNTPGDRSFMTIDGPWNAPVSPDGQLIAPTGSGGLFALWDVTTGTLVRRLDSLNGNAAVFSQDGQRIATGTRSVICYETSTGKKLFETGSHSGTIYGIAHNSGLGVFASAGDHTVRMWNDHTGDSVATIVLPYPAYTAAFTPDAKELIIGCRNGSILFCSTADWKIVDSLKLPSTVNNLAITPDGARCVVAGDASSYVIDITGRNQSHTLRGHTKWVYGLALHPEIPLAVTSSYDRSVRVWDLQNGNNILTLYGFEKELYTASLTQSGSRLVITDVEGTVHVVDITR